MHRAAETNRPREEPGALTGAAARRPMHILCVFESCVCSKSSSPARFGRSPRSDCRRVFLRLGWFDHGSAVWRLRVDMGFSGRV